ncbi:hypothetical protein OG894_45065 (plasmid) [Streptomyces sp. NBC_01724]|uniref:hypothetical protein n=1 Tax=Streptomyces sp. NBC_01724 TaxID=2975922 RepID=UPI002E3713AC|nr:hypothetical protein [Streptomyces sp. NBC_01724]
MALTSRQRREASHGRHTPRLWSVWLVAPLALLAVAALSYVIYHNVYDLLADTAAGQTPGKPVNVNDVIKTTVTVLTLIGAVLAGIYAYRKQLLAEGDAHRADASQLADRYTTAAEQLGHDQAGRPMLAPRSRKPTCPLLRSTALRATAERSSVSASSWPTSRGPSW